MIVWGGGLGEASLAAGAAYDPATDRWTELAPSPLRPRDDFEAEGLACQEAEAFVRAAGRRLGPVTGPALSQHGQFDCARINQVDDPLPNATYECTSGPKRIVFVRT